MPVIRRGFTVAELVVAIALGAVVATLAVRGLLSARRAWSRAVATADGSTTLREAFGVIERELRGLGADSASTDLVLVEPSRVVYRAARQVRFLCAPPDPVAGVLVLERAYRGLREIDATVDSLLAYPSWTDGPWRALALAGPLAPATCSDGSPGLAAPVQPAAALRTLRPGDPVRVFETAELRRYRGGRGRWWLGMRRATLAGGFPVIQPLTGPLAVGGLEFLGRNRAGGIAVIPRDIVRIDVTVTVAHPTGGRRVRRFPVALRNAP